MWVQVTIVVVLVVVGVLLVRVGSRAWRSLMDAAGDGVDEQSLQDAHLEVIEPEGRVGPDGLVVLFGHQFVERASSSRMVSPRLRCYAPITDDELDAQHWAQQVLYATLTGLYEAGCIELRVVERTATLMPPYPQKSWELQLAQVGPMPESPISDVLAVGFDLLRRRQRAGAESDDPEARGWVSLDQVVEQSLKTMRQEISFWQRSGVFGDIRQYVEAALIAQGYLIEPARPTWLDRLRHKRPYPHEEGVAGLESDARDLAASLKAFQQKHGAGLLEGESETEALRQVDPSLLSPTEALEDLPLDEVLRISIHETLVSLRQLEPSGDAGV